MFKRWRRGSADPGNQAEPQIPWLDIDASEVGRYPDLIPDILGRKAAGVTVRRVFTEAEVERAVERLPENREGETPVVFGTVLGRPLMQSGMSRDRTQHLDDAERFRPVFLDLFGMDPHARLAEVFGALSGGMALTAPTEDGRSYNPGQIRIMDPGGGGLAAHAGNEFLMSNKDGSASHLWETTDAIDHMSYFVMMQPAEQGGELSVYERLWEDTRDEHGNVTPLTHDASAFDDAPHLTIAPGPGDLILFWAGRRWHRVEQVLGPVPRITYGGFTAPSRDHTELHCWA